MSGTRARVCMCLRHSDFVCLAAADSDSDERTFVRRGTHRRRTIGDDYDGDDNSMDHSYGMSRTLCCAVCLTFSCLRARVCVCVCHRTGSTTEISQLAPRVMASITFLDAPDNGESVSLRERSRD